MLSLTVVFILIVVGGYYAMQLPKMTFPADPDGAVNITVQGTATDSVDSLRKAIIQFAPFYQDNKVAYYIIGSNKDSQTGVVSMRAQLQYHDRYLKKSSGFL